MILLPTGKLVSDDKKNDWCVFDHSSSATSTWLHPNFWEAIRVARQSWKQATERDGVWTDFPVPLTIKRVHGRTHAYSAVLVRKNAEPPERKTATVLVAPRAVQQGGKEYSALFKVGERERFLRGKLLTSDEKKEEAALREIHKELVLGEQQRGLTEAVRYEAKVEGPRLYLLARGMIYLQREAWCLANGGHSWIPVLHWGRIYHLCARCATYAYNRNHLTAHSPATAAKTIYNALYRFRPIRQGWHHPDVENEIMNVKCLRVASLLARADSTFDERIIAGADLQRVVEHLPLTTDIVRRTVRHKRTDIALLLLGRMKAEQLEEAAKCPELQGLVLEHMLSTDHATRARAS